MHKDAIDMVDREKRKRKKERERKKADSTRSSSENDCGEPTLTFSESRTRADETKQEAYR